MYDIDTRNSLIEEDLRIKGQTFSCCTDIFVQVMITEPSVWWRDIGRKNQWIDQGLLVYSLVNRGEIGLSKGEL